MVKEAERGRDLIARMDILKVIRQAIRAWYLDIANNTIANYQIKSGLLGLVYTCAPALKGYKQY